MNAFRSRTLPCLIVCLGLASGVARATNFPVTKTADTADGSCDADCSLREAIIAANANPGPDVITIPGSATPYIISIAPVGAIPPTGENNAGANGNNPLVGDFDITGELTINGAGPGGAIPTPTPTVIEANNVSRIFHIHAGPVTINGLRVMEGMEAAGGGIFVEAVTTVNLTNVVVNGNNGLGSAGGGIRNTGGTLTITDSTISNNVGTAQGAGIVSTGTLNIVRSTISGNMTTESGGGMRIEGGTVTITNSTISGNTASSGGGIRNFNGNVTVVASTIADNTATVSGGGVTNFTGTVVTLTGSILANNTAPTGPDCFETIASGGFNLIENTTGCTITGTTTGNVTGADPQLLGLTENGGPTLTRSLQPGSPALNAFTSGCPPPATDQRGVSRPQSTACEIGAFECLPTECGQGVGPTATPTQPGPTATPTATPTPTIPGPTATPTATATVPAPTATPTNTPVTGAPAPNVPTLSFPMLALLGLALAGAAMFFLRRG